MSVTHTMARGEDEEDVDEGGLMGSTCQDHRTGLLLAAGYLRYAMPCVLYWQVQEQVQETRMCLCL